MNYHRLRIPLIKLYKKTPRIIRKIAFKGDKRYCLVCANHVSKFFRGGRAEMRLDAVCPICGSLDRHRFIWFILKKYTDLFEDRAKTMLHIAPESAFEHELRKISQLTYITADLLRKDVTINMDVTNIQFINEVVDVIMCSHVLEHVSDDRRALSEFYRILKPGAWAVILVPIIATVTFEDNTITDPVDRRRLYGQEDHVRAYGLDFAQRLIDAGFVVDTYKPEDELSQTEMKLYGIRLEDTVFLCRKVSSP